MRIGAAIGAAVMAYHMGVPHRRTAPVSAGAIGWDASIGLHTNSDPWPEHERAQRLLRKHCTVGKLYSKWLLHTAGQR